MIVQLMNNLIGLDYEAFDFDHGDSFVMVRKNPLDQSDSSKGCRLPHVTFERECSVRLFTAN